MAENALTQAAIGFLTVVDEPAHGLFGGYLILNPAGRPVEFHCTAPVKPNRAQEILYGTTLQPYLYGEQIARALIEKSKILPRVVCFDQACAMCVRPIVSVPAILVEPAEGAESVPDSQILWQKKQILSALPDQPGDIPAVRKVLAELVIEFDFMEPFERIRSAISEAQKGI
ncbi:MAG: hypothetical protein IJK97_08755 [Thermoguttaceae bacterium]|nr:hypothetical protein [Thermoguttaceae bacterium]MBR0191784.1 hypothetical protein [Thermoguttaceae bacterium]